MEYLIRNARISDKEALIEFIKTDWKSDHIFVKDPDFFDYFYLDKNRYNFILGINPNTQSIVGALGFQPYSKDNSGDLFLALWKVRKGIEDPSLGLKLLQYLKKEYTSLRLHCLGINKKTLNIYRFQGYEVGLVDQFFKLNPHLTNFFIASVSAPDLLENLNETIDNNVYTFQIMDSEEIRPVFEKIQTNFFPKKSWEIFKSKYLNHPYYEYQILKAMKGDLLSAVVVLRKISISNRSCWRVIDFIGIKEVISKVMSDLTESLLTDDIEYVDVCIAGLDKDQMKKEGFKLLAEENSCVIPNYFEPFEKKNVEIYYFTSLKNDFCFFKGDGDQDRPSLPKREINE